MMAAQPYETRSRPEQRVRAPTLRRLPSLESHQSFDAQEAGCPQDL